MPRNIGVEASALGYPQGGGIRTFLYYALRELVKLDLNNNYFIYTTGSATGDRVPVPEENPRWHMRRASGVTALKPVVWLQTGFTKVALRDRLDVIWLTRHVPPLLLRHVPMVATIFDLFYLRVPQMFPFYTRLMNKVFTGWTVHRSSRIIATSRATADDLVTLLNAEPAKIDVAYGGVDDHHFFPRDPRVAQAYALHAHHVNKPFMLAVDIYNARKNFAGLLDAYWMLPQEIRRRYDIVATGTPPRHYRRLNAAEKIRKLGLEDSIHLIGYVDHSDMPMIYTAASLLVFPSHYEGFGLPIVEAMACGCPVVTSSRSSMPEAAGMAGLFADPHDPSALARQIERVLTDCHSAAELRKRGLAHARHFTWRSFAETVLQALESAAITSDEYGASPASQ